MPGFVNTDYVLNGQGHGPIGQAMVQSRFDTGLLRPFFDPETGKECVIVNTSRGLTPKYEQFTVQEARAMNMPVVNAGTSLRKDEWILLDKTVLEVQRERLRAWSDLAAASSFGGFDGMAKTILEYETMSDSGEAMSDMDGLTEGRHDQPRYQLEGLPLQITHSDFFFGSRTLSVSRNTGTPLDLSQARHATRKVVERIEKTLIGTVTGITYGNASIYSRNPTVYGYTNFGPRITKTTNTVPTGSNATAVVGNVLDMINLAANRNFFGPFMLYHSTDYDRYMDDDYAVTGGNNPSQTLRNRLRAIEGITDVRRLDFLKSSTNPWTLLLVQMTEDVAQAVTGMGITTIQWETKGGMQQNFKVMGIMVPRLRATYDGYTGIVHGTTS